MSRAIVRNWNERSDGPMTIDAVRSKYPPVGNRIKEAHYQPGEKFHSSMRSGIWYVFSGRGRVRFEEDVLLERGQIAEMPEGSYSLEVLGDHELHLAIVWKLPPPFVQ